MLSYSSNTKRIARNTMLLYFRMLLTMLVSLYTSRVVLNALGVEDYGIYNVVGGLVAMFGILSGSLSVAISRFITFELGKGDLEKLKRIFCTSINIQIILIAIITVLLETIGIWLLNAKMVIPEERLTAANWVFQFSVVTFALNLLSVPYNAVIIAHEKMSAFAYISIIDCTLKLIVAFIIAYNPFDKLVYYGLLIMIVGAINRSIYAIYCKRHFEEATYKMIFDKGLMKEMFGFAGWSMFGTSSALLRDQGGNLLINIYYGPAVNAARGIAMQVNTAILSFVNSFTTAVNPQITKSYASGDNEYMLKLAFQSTKFSFFIMWVISLPILITTPFLLNLWLVEVPEHTVNFIRLVVIFSMSEVLQNSLITMLLATGKIKTYQLILGSCQLLNFPICWFCLYLGMASEIVFVIAIIISVICEMIRIFMCQKMVGLSARSFLTSVYFRVIVVAILSMIVPVLIGLRFNELSFAPFVILAAISVVSAVTFIYFVGCDKHDKAVIATQFNKIKSRFFK